MASAPKAAFYEKYSAIAMEQQQKYGIPASITLAQMYLESGRGTSTLAREGNNYFGIKCPPGWVESGKPYTLHSDDRPNEKFCSYASVEDSVAHHSQFLMGARYARCREYAATDYASWARGLQAAGYATDPRYAAKLLDEIKTYGLDKYDRQAASGQASGVALGSRHGQAASAADGSVADVRMLAPVAGGWSMPLGGDKLIQTCEYGDTVYHKNPHNGVDLRAAIGTPVLATEDRGVVSQASFDPKGGGNYVYVKYERPDHTQYEVGYLHLSKIDVSVGDTVSAGQQLGLSGNSGRSTGPHLDFRVKENGVQKDPLDYLAEVSVRGGLDVSVERKGDGCELLAERKETMTLGSTVEKVEVDLAHIDGSKNLEKNDEGYAPKNLLEYLLGSKMSGSSSEQSGDLFSSLLSGLFMAAIGMAMTLDRSNNSSETVAVKTSVEEESEQQRNATLVRRQRDSVDVDKARELAQMNYDAMNPEQRENVGQRLA